MFIIVWRGLGILVPVVMLACIVCTNLAVDFTLRNPDYSKWHYWPKALGAVLAAAAVWLVGRYLHSRPGEIVIERNSLGPIERKKVHSLFGIRFEYWAFRPLAFSVIGYFV
jgi:hypothetical protein